MESKERKILFWNRITAALLLAILSVMAALGAHLEAACEELTPMLRRVDELTVTLEQIDTAALLDSVNSITDELSDTDVQGLVTTLHELCATLNSIDWIGLSENINETALDAQESLSTAQTAMDKAVAAIDSLDIESLNNAVSELKDVVEPLAALMKR